MNAAKHTVAAISISESPDMQVLGFGKGHLKEAMAKMATQLLAFGADLAYGGDLRSSGLTRLLFELVLRYRRDHDVGNGVRVTDYLAWPVHIRMPADELKAMADELQESTRLALIGDHGDVLTMEKRQSMKPHEPSDQEWTEGLTAMRQIMRSQTDVRISLGGRLEGYKGRMPGIAEEVLLSLQSKQAVFLLGGFGGCTHDIAEDLNLIEPWEGSRPAWCGREQFKQFTAADLNNGLSEDENRTLAQTPYIDQAVLLVLQGLNRIHDNARGIAQDA